MWVIGVIILLLAAEYGMTPVYTPPAARPFAGARLYNPYANADGPWLRANFHAHTRIWGGLLRGTYTADDLLNEYVEQGYDVAAVSEYMGLTSDKGLNGWNIPCYEHGANLLKVHQGTIGARKVDRLDFPLYQWFGQKQWIISRMHYSARVVVLNHAAWNNAYTRGDMQTLCGYDGIEVVSRYANSVDLWDAALSAGRPVWAFVGDDVHRQNFAGRYCMMVQPKEPTVDAIIDALKTGRAYAVVRAHERINDNALKRLEVVGNTIQLECTAIAKKIEFVGQDGKVKKTVTDIAHASYDFQPDDTYIRAVVYSPYTTLYLNPVFRCEGNEPVRLMPELNVLATRAKRIGTVIGLVAIVGLVIYRRLRRQSGARE